MTRSAYCRHNNAHMTDKPIHINPWLAERINEYREQRGEKMLRKDFEIARRMVEQLVVGAAIGTQDARFGNAEESVPDVPRLYVRTSLKHMWSFL